MFSTTGFPLDEAIPFELDGSRYRYYTFGGTWANVILALLLRRQGYHVAEDGLRVATDRRLADFSFLPTEISDLQEVVAENLPTFVRQMALSDHFRRLSTDHQVQEVCSLLDLARVAGWFKAIRPKELGLLPDDEG